MIRTRGFSILFCSLLVSACASTVLEYDKNKAEQALKNEEYERTIKVKVVEAPPTPVEVKAVPETAAVPEKKKKVKKEKVVAPKKIGPHQPDLEDSEGFVGRRP